MQFSLSCAPERDKIPFSEAWGGGGGVGCGIVVSGSTCGSLDLIAQLGGEEDDYPDFGYQYGRGGRIA
jgi:hypothetical protein